MCEQSPQNWGNFHLITLYICIIPVDAVLCNLHTCVCTEFLMTCAEIFTKGLPESPAVQAAKSRSSTSASSKPSATSQASQQPKEEAPKNDMRIKAVLKDPEIIIVADSSTVDTNALILRVNLLWSSSSFPLSTHSSSSFVFFFSAPFLSSSSSLFLLLLHFHCLLHHLFQYGGNIIQLLLFLLILPFYLSSTCFLLFFLFSPLHLLHLLLFFCFFILVIVFFIIFFIMEGTLFANCVYFRYLFLDHWWD